MSGLKNKFNFYKMEISKIIKESKLIKNDPVKVYNYKNKFIIKKREYSAEIIKQINAEKDFLEYAFKNNVKIHKIKDIIVNNGNIYIVYNFVIWTKELDFLETWRNFRLLHKLKYNYPFSSDIYRTPLTKLNILWDKEHLIWENIKEKSIKDYNNIFKAKNKNIVIHWDFDLTNVIEPNIIIDTERLRMWIEEDDIVSFFRIWYRYGKKEAMNKLLDWYWYKKQLDYILPYLYYKDMLSTNWLIVNNKKEESRINEIKTRLENWYNWDHIWSTY